MYLVKRLLVGLDLTDMDQKLLSYTSVMVKLFEVEMVYFLHVAKSLDIPQNVREKYSEIITPTDEALKKEISANIDKYFTGGCKYDIEVREGNAEDKILRWADFKEIDMLVMGRKMELRGSGLLPGKLARTIHCSMLLVPENSRENISKVMVPIDFSKTSLLAFEEALLIKKATGAEIILQNSYTVPSGYHLSGKSYEEFGEIMKSNAYEDAVEFIGREKVKATDVEILLTLDEDNDPARKAYEEASTRNCDLIIIGSRGRTGIASILLGSVADKMTRYDTNIPLLIVKDKKENLSFLQALLKL